MVPYERDDLGIGHGVRPFMETPLYNIDQFVVEINGLGECGGSTRTSCRKNFEVKVCIYYLQRQDQDQFLDTHVVDTSMWTVHKKINDGHLVGSFRGWHLHEWPTLICQLFTFENAESWIFHPSIVMPIGVFRCPCLHGALSIGFPMKHVAIWTWSTQLRRQAE